MAFIMPITVFAESEVIVMETEISQEEVGGPGIEVVEYLDPIVVFEEMKVELTEWFTTLEQIKEDDIFTYLTMVDEKILETNTRIEEMEFLEDKDQVEDQINEYLTNAKVLGEENNLGRIGDIKLIWPLPKAGVISSRFGLRDAPLQGASTYHQGLDIAISKGTPIFATADGIVTTSTYSQSAGNYITINHEERLQTVYMHCTERFVDVGDSVSKGMIIGTVGSTGNSTGSHLHYGIKIDGVYVDLEKYVSSNEI